MRFDGIAFGCQLLIELARRGRRAPTLGDSQHAHELNAPIERDREHVSCLYDLRRLVDLYAVETNFAGADEI